MLDSLFNVNSVLNVFLEYVIEINIKLNRTYSKNHDLFKLKVSLYSQRNHYLNI